MFQIPMAFAISAASIAGAFLVFSVSAFATDYSFRPIRHPAAAGPLGTEAFGINESGQIVGARQHGAFPSFHYARGNFRDLNLPFPESSTGIARGINDAGDIVGYFSNKTGALVGYVEQRGTHRRIELPSASWTVTNGINNRGAIVGYFVTPRGFALAFVLANEKLTTIDPPHSPSHPLYGLVSIYAYGINDAGHIVGSTSHITPGRSNSGYVVVNGRFTALDFPGAKETFAYGINNAGRIVGYYIDNRGTRGFLYENGSYTSIDFPGAKQTWVWGISNRGELVGAFDDGTQRVGFIAAK